MGAVPHRPGRLLLGQGPGRGRRGRGVPGQPRRQGGAAHRGRGPAAGHRRRGREGGAARHPGPLGAGRQGAARRPRAGREADAARRDRRARGRRAALDAHQPRGGGPGPLPRRPARGVRRVDRGRPRQGRGEGRRQGGRGGPGAARPPSRSGSRRRAPGSTSSAAEPPAPQGPRTGVEPRPGPAPRRPAAPRRTSAPWHGTPRRFDVDLVVAAAVRLRRPAARRSRSAGAAGSLVVRPAVRAAGSGLVQRHAHRHRDHHPRHGAGAARGRRRGRGRLRLLRRHRRGPRGHHCSATRARRAARPTDLGARLHPPRRAGRVGLGGRVDRRVRRSPPTPVVLAVPDGPRSAPETGDVGLDHRRRAHAPARPDDAPPSAGWRSWWGCRRWRSSPRTSASPPSPASGHAQPRRPRGDPAHRPRLRPRRLRVFPTTEQQVHQAAVRGSRVATPASTAPALEYPLVRRGPPRPTQSTP